MEYDVGKKTLKITKIEHLASSFTLSYGLGKKPKHMESDVYKMLFYAPKDPTKTPMSTETQKVSSFRKSFII